jgi:hypothetical protein
MSCVDLHVERYDWTLYFVFVLIGGWKFRVSGVEKIQLANVLVAVVRLCNCLILLGSMWLSDHASTRCGLCSTRPGISLPGFSDLWLDQWRWMVGVDAAERCDLCLIYVWFMSDLCLIYVWFMSDLCLIYRIWSSVDANNMQREFFVAGPPDAGSWHHPGWMEIAVGCTADPGRILANRCFVSQANTDL